MDRELAKRITELAESIDNWTEPSERLSARIADAMFRAEEQREKELDGLCLMALRQMVLAEARRIANADVKLVEKTGWRLR